MKILGLSGIFAIRVARIEKCIFSKHFFHFQNQTRNTHEGWRGRPAYSFLCFAIFLSTLLHNFSHSSSTLCSTKVWIQTTEKTEKTSTCPQPPVIGQKIILRNSVCFVERVHIFHSRLVLRCTVEEILFMYTKKVDIFSRGQLFYDSLF